MVPHNKPDHVSDGLVYHGGPGEDGVGGDGRLGGGPAARTMGGGGQSGTQHSLVHLAVGEHGEQEGGDSAEDGKEEDEEGSEDASDADTGEEESQAQAGPGQLCRHAAARLV